MMTLILQAMQEFVDEPLRCAAIEQACNDCEAELRARPELEMTYRAVSSELKLNGEMAALRSLWVFAFAPNGESDIHRHSNSTQYTRAWRGKGRMRVGDPKQMVEISLPSELDASATERQWTVIPTGIFHQAVAGANGWYVVSFQTAPGAELQDEPFEGEARYYISE